jgi:predicted HD phosphohydrolase
MTPFDTALSGVEELFALFDARGHEHDGEDVTQTAHALQSAALAHRDGATDELVAAALLHDVGHLVADARPAGWRVEVDDDAHDAAGARLLAPLLGARVAGPVALHVTAKRWRCAVDPDYLGTLSATSRATLRAQGGPLGQAARARFEAHPTFRDAVALRQWDDDAKDPTAAVGELRDHAPLLVLLARRAASGR